MEDKNMKQIKNFEEYYITDTGEVYSYKNKKRVKKGWRKLKPTKNRNGYLYVTLVCGEDKRRVDVHRLVAEYFCEGYFEGAVVNHIDADKQNNYYKNLEWITQKENVRKSYETSGLNQVRNFRFYTLVYPDGRKSVRMKTFKKLSEYIENEGLNVSALTLRNYGKSKGYKMIKENI